MTEKVRKLRSCSTLRNSRFISLVTFYLTWMHTLLFVCLFSSFIIVLSVAVHFVSQLCQSVWPVSRLWFKEMLRWKWRCAISVSAQDGIVPLGKAHTRSTRSLSSLPKVALKIVPIFVWLNTDRSRPWRVECQPLPFSTPLSFRRSMLWCNFNKQYKNSNKRKNLTWWNMDQFYGRK